MESSKKVTTSWKNLDKHLKEKKTDLELNVLTVASGNTLKSSGFWLGMLWFFGILAAVAVVVTIFMFKRIRIAVTILEEATKVINIFHKLKYILRLFSHRI